MHASFFGKISADDESPAKLLIVWFLVVGFVFSSFLLFRSGSALLLLPQARDPRWHSTLYQCESLAASRLRIIATTYRFINDYNLLLLLCALHMLQDIIKQSTTKSRTMSGLINKSRKKETIISIDNSRFCMSLFKWVFFGYAIVLLLFLPSFSSVSLFCICACILF